MRPLSFVAGEALFRRWRLDKVRRAKRVNVVLKLVIQVTRGLIRDQRARRQIMFYSLLAALVMLFIGSTLLAGWLRPRPVLFLIYWGVCAWITLAAMLLAIFDILMIRAAVRRARRRLEAEYMESTRGKRPYDSNPPGS